MKLFERPRGVTSANSSPARALSGNAAAGYASNPRPAAVASAVFMRGWPWPRFAFQVTLPKSIQLAPSSVEKRAPSPPTIASAWASACADHVKNTRWRWRSVTDEVAGGDTMGPYGSRISIRDPE